MPIAKIRVFPPIGVARIGDAEVDPSLAFLERDDFFIGPRMPGKVKTPEGGYKKDGKVKRQAAEFRLYA